MISIFGNVGKNLHLEITSTREQAAEDWAGKAGEKAASSPLPIHSLIAAKYPACLHSSSPNAPVKILYTRFFRQTTGWKICQTYHPQLYFRNISKDILA